MLEALTQGLERDTLDPPPDPRDPEHHNREIAKHAVECLSGFCRANRASLYLREPDGGMTLAASHGDCASLPKELPQFSHDSPTLMARALRTATPLFLDDVSAYRKSCGLHPPSYARGRPDPSCIVLPLSGKPALSGESSEPSDAVPGVVNLSALRSPPPGEGSVRRHALIHGAHLVALGMRLRSSLHALEARASRDGLTDLFNYRTFYETLGREVFRAERYHSHLSLVMFDIDHFKRINDRYGHLAGDAILVQLAERLRGALRSADIAARYAGDELAVILPETRLTGALRVAERIRADVARESFDYLQSPIEVTISVGVAELHSGMTAVDLVNSADRQLYQAKDRGRNCVAADL